MNFFISCLPEILSGRDSIPLPLLYRTTVFRFKWKEARVFVHHCYLRSGPSSQ